LPQGNPFPVPEWFKEGLPKDEPLDGELWCGRQKFRQAMSIIKNQGSGTQWEFATYLVFDAPERRTESYEERVAWIGANIRYKVTTPWAKAVGVECCTGLDHLKDELESVEARGGEGLMLRQPLSRYEHGTRSGTLLKVR
jgi:DNA ligase-1